MGDSITVETDLFEHREVKPHFINPCCFGEDFAAWLKKELAPLTDDGFSFSEPIQEDYGWGLRARHARASFWIGLSYVGEGPQEPPAQWVVSIDQPAFNPLNLAFGRSRREAFCFLLQRVRQILATNSAIEIIDI